MRHAIPALLLLAAPAAAQEQSPDALMAALSGGNCVMPLSEAPLVLGRQGFTEGFVRETLTGMVIDGTAWVDPGGVLRVDDSICPASDLASAPPTPRAAVAEGLRAVDGCSVRQGDLAGLFPAADRETLTAVVRAMVADGEARVDRFTLSVAGEGCPELMPAAAPAEAMEEAPEPATPAEAQSAETAVGDADDGDAAAMAEGAERTEAAATAVAAVEGAPTLSEDPTEGAPEELVAETQAAPEEPAADMAEADGAADAAAAGADAEEAPAEDAADAGSDESPAETAVAAIEDAPVIEGDATDGATEAVEAEAQAEVAADAPAGQPDAPQASDTREALVAAVAGRDCAIRQSQIDDVLPGADAEELLQVVMGLVADGSAEIDRFTLRLSDEACAAARD